MAAMVFIIKYLSSIYLSSNWTSPLKKLWCKRRGWRHVTIYSVSKHFLAALTMGCLITATKHSVFRFLSGFLPFIYWLRPLFQGSFSTSHILPSCNACCSLRYPDKNTWKKQCFDSTLGKRAYKPLSEKQSLCESCGRSYQTQTIFRISAQRYLSNNAFSSRSTIRPKGWSQDCPKHGLQDEHCCWSSGMRESKKFGIGIVVTHI